MFKENMHELTSITLRDIPTMPQELRHELNPTCVVYTLLKYMLSIIKDMDYSPVSKLDKAFKMLKNNPSLADHTCKTLQMLKEKVMERQHESQEQVAQHHLSLETDILGPPQDLEKNMQG